jgi:multiple sugar transport system substrate-binding protein
VKRTKAVLAGLTSLALIASACGSDESSDDTTDDTTDESTEDSAPASDEGESADAGSDGEVSLRWRTRPDNDTEAELYASVSETIDAANDGFALEYEPGGTDTSAYQDQLITEIGSGTAPDVFWIPGTDIARFQGEGLLLDLGEMAAADSFDTSDFYPEPMFHLTYDREAGAPGDQLWGLPRDVSTFGLYLNLDLIAEAGADDPRVLAAEGAWDWAAFAEVSEKITALGGANKGYAMDGWWAPYGAFINGAGGSFFNEDRTECALDTPEAIAGLAQATALYDAGVTVPFGEDSATPFKAGTVGMFQTGRWATPGMRTDNDFNWDVAPLPTGPGGTQGNWLFWGAYVVNANTEHPAEAWQLVQELTTAETQGAISELGANIPSRQSDEAIDAFLGFTPPENNQAFIDGLADSPTAEGPLWAGSWPAYDEAMGNAVTALFNGDRTIEDFQANICSEVSGAFD